MPTPNDNADNERRDDVVDFTNPANVRYWADKLMVTEAALRALAGAHGGNVAVLRHAVDRATKTETSRIFPPASTQAPRAK